MRQKTLFIITLLFTKFLFGQTNDVWVRFIDTTTDLSGYKDLKGIIKIPATFETLTRADTFYNIIAVSEEIGSSYVSYYLLKDGGKVGKDSVFMFDFQFDCESEGKILFGDREKDRVGFFDKNGIAVIPAVYNYASPFRNGLAVAHRNAKRKCWDGSNDTTACEHLGWQGGESILINEKNEILVDSLNINTYNLDWYSKRVNDFTVDTSVFTNIKGRKGVVYSFIDLEKEFKKWFYSVFLASLNSNDKGKLKDLCFPEITYWSEKAGWTSLNKDAFFRTFPASIFKERFQETAIKQIATSQQTMDPFMIEKESYNRFYNACGEYNREKYPVFDVMLTYYKKRTKKLPNILLPAFDKTYEIKYQEHFEFLRTEDGYKLLNMSLKE